MDEQLLQDAARASVFHLPADRWDGVVAAATRAGLRAGVVKLGNPREKDLALRDLGRALNFPDWYGTNFDALFDCLTDPDWQPAPGHVLLISGLDALQCAEPENFSTLIEVFRAAADSRRDAGTPLWILVDIAAPGIPPVPVV